MSDAKKEAKDDSKGEVKIELKAERTQEGKRLFVGARISTATSSSLASATQMLARRARDGGIDVRWMPPESYHITFKFLGWTRIEAVEAVRDALIEACRGTPTLVFRCGRIGAFPALERAGVVWAGIEGDAVMNGLVGRIEAAMVGLGYPAEHRPFHPHVTVGRLKENRPLKEVVLPVAEQMFGETRIDSITLFESETKSSGSVYREVARIDFKPASIGVAETAERQTRGVDLDETDDGWPRGQGPGHP
ncbi:MAG: RNA 2',3'-cyclic phosphodiesterase [Kofleriaceae bacterium]|nr:RNA 2',3'-cyclic phosphodiesterase [Kofleriaceae bacterium]